MKEYKFGLEEIKGMLKEMIVLVDSREQKNAHILDYFQRQGIPYEVEKLDYGDYSCNKEESAILQHENTGVGRMLRELVNTIRARQIRTFRTP